MGEILAMIPQSLSLRLTLVAAVSLTLLAGCTSRLAQTAAVAAIGATALPAPQVNPIDARVQSLTLLDRKVKFAVVPVKQSGDVTVWAAADGAQVALRDGVMIWSRGYGMDLMSAEAPPLSALSRVGGQHSRVYYWLDGSDKPVSQSFSCSISQEPYTNGAPGERHFVEACMASGGAKLTNDFVISSKGRIVESRQWLSPMVGMMYLEPAN